MNNTKSQNGNLYSLTLLVKKNKKIFGKERTNLPDWPGGGVGCGFSGRIHKKGGGGRRFVWIQGAETAQFACKTYHFPQIRNEKGRKSTTKGQK